MVKVLCRLIAFVMIFGGDLYGLVTEASLGEGNALIAMGGHGGFGNQVYQYLGLAASMRVAREANQISTSWECEFVFQDASVGPSKHNFVKLNKAYERFSWPEEDCKAKKYFTSPVLPNTTQEILNFSVDELQKMIGSGYQVHVLTTKSCMYNSKSLCFMNGISTRKYWKTLMLLGSQIKLLYKDEQYAKRNEQIRNLTREKYLDEKAVCVHLRGKEYEHHRNHQFKITSVKESLQLGLETYRQLNRTLEMTTLSIITAVGIDDVWNETLEILSVRDRTELDSINTVIMQGQHTLVKQKASELHEFPVEEDSHLGNWSRWSVTLDITNLLYLDLLRMARCSWLVIAEPLGRGSFSGTAALWSAKHYCTSMQWLLCDPKVAHASNLSTTIPWSQDLIKRLVKPPVYQI